MYTTKLNLGLLFALVAIVNAQAAVDKCPKDEIACLDIINSSQCIANVIIDGRPPLTKANLAMCVEHEGTASSLPGAEKFCRCTGCHTAQINEAIIKTFNCTQ
ncbi:hypothetical protein QBC37DRAFT_400589 [Rhypophila decipiens]|uniref:Uncharacterized protein n=1 Tax=Rhypophila decipiens TaxID=261697 RepID=A0AAN7B9U9_9PEZI|nr:hypothetical protein QBC37DRAFT_400589 [Rhypophila decipiens]